MCRGEKRERTRSRVFCRGELYFLPQKTLLRHIGHFVNQTKQRARFTHSLPLGRSAACSIIVLARRQPIQRRHHPPPARQHTHQPRRINQLPRRLHIHNIHVNQGRQQRARAGRKLGGGRRGGGQACRVPLEDQVFSWRVRSVGRPAPPANSSARLKTGGDSVALPSKSRCTHDRAASDRGMRGATAGSRANTSMSVSLGNAVRSNAVNAQFVRSWVKWGAVTRSIASGETPSWR